MYYGTIGLVSMVITVLFTRWVFQVHTMARHTQAQTKLLAKIAEKQGVDERDIKTILHDAFS